MIPARNIKLLINDKQSLSEAVSVHRAAFGQNDEADLTQTLLNDPSAKPTLSCTAIEDDQAVAHVLFSSVTIDAHPDTKASILCPLAVLPTKHNSGLGTFVVEGGLTNLRLQGTQSVFVLGDPNYYKRFGFVPALPKGLRPPYELPNAYIDAWMVLELDNGASKKYEGTITCADTLMAKEFWLE